MINNLFDYDLIDIKNGYARETEPDRYICLVCGKTFACDEVFELDGHFFQPKRAAELHVRSEHGGMETVLLSYEKKVIGLTDNQRELFGMLLQGLSDSEIAAKTGSASATVRHIRFTLRERAKQAKLYLALYELVDQVSRKKDTRHALIEIHQGAKMVDDRYEITADEEKKILKSCFESLSPMKLKVFSAKEKKKIIILKQIATLFKAGETYTERQVSMLLQPVYPDYATLRRYLVEYGFMERNADGSVYRLNGNDGAI